MRSCWKLCARCNFTFSRGFSGKGWRCTVLLLYNSLQYVSAWRTSICMDDDSLLTSEGNQPNVKTKHGASVPHVFHQPKTRRAAETYPLQIQRAATTRDRPTACISGRRPPGHFCGAAAAELETADLLLRQGKGQKRGRFTDPISTAASLHSPPAYRIVP